MREGIKTGFARHLRANMTDVERYLWRHLRQRQVEGHRFRRQHPIGPYIADFACLESRIVIEVDGGQHADSALDASRSRFLVGEGYLVLRFWNHEVLGNIGGVIRAIRHAFAAVRPHPSLPPQAGEGAKGKGRSPEGEEG